MFFWAQLSGSVATQYSDIYRSLLLNDSGYWDYSTVDTNAKIEGINNKKINCTATIQYRLFRFTSIRCVCCASGISCLRALHFGRTLLRFANRDVFQTGSELKQSTQYYQTHLVRFLSTELDTEKRGVLLGSTNALFSTPDCTAEGIWLSVVFKSQVCTHYVYSLSCDRLITSLSTGGFGDAASWASNSEWNLSN